MSDLEDAAQAAVLGVRALRQRVDEARSASDTALERLGKLADSLASDRDALHEAVDELGTTVEEAAKQVSDDVAATESAMADLAGVVRDAGGQGHGALDDEAAALKGLAEHLQLLDTQVDVLAGAAVSASKAALERADAIAEALDDVVDDAERYLFDFVALLEELGREVENASIAARSVLSNAYVPVLEEKERDFASKTEAIVDVLKTKFAEMEQHAEEVAEYSLGQFRLFVDDEKASIEVKVQAAAIELEELTRLAVARVAEVDDAGSTLVRDLRQNSEAAQAAEQALHHVRGRWMLFGFGV